MTNQAILGSAVDHARAQGVDPALLAGLIDRESGFSPRAGDGADDGSSNGAARRGLLQLRFDTAQWAGYEGEPAGLYDVQESLRYGTLYLGYLLDRYGGDPHSALAAFHAGSSAVDREGWRTAQPYVEDVLERTARLRPQVESVAAERGVEAVDFAPAFRYPLKVPFWSQMERMPTGEVSGGNNCGPASVTMAVLYNRLVPLGPAVMHRIAEGIRQAPWHAGTYTNFQQMRSLAHRYKVAYRDIFSWEAVTGSLDVGQPVIILVDNTKLQPRQYPIAGFAGAHFITLTGYDDESFFVNDPLRVFGRPEQGPGTYTRQSVAAGVASVRAQQGIASAVLAIAIDRVAPPEAEKVITEEEAMIPISDADLQQYLNQAGQRVNMETALVKRACLAHRRGETRGPALSGEYAARTADGRDVIRQKFTAGIAEYNPASGEVSWVEVVAHPDTI